VTGSQADVLAGVRRLLAEVTGSPRALDAPASTPLLRAGLGLDSLGATVLLTRVQSRYGVDVAAEDLNLDSLASIAALAAFIADRA
jgi:acyl carrier protein